MWTRILIFLVCLLETGFALDCLSCDSNFDSNCATLIRNTSSVLCEEENDECSTWIVGSRTFRGCLSDKDDDIENYESCASGNFCNNDVFPKDRLKCITCSANNTDCVAPSANLLFPCRNYVKNDKCYSYIINETSVIRGCMSDDNENVATCQSADELCTQCSEEFCNFQSGTSDIECIVCSGDEYSACGYYLPLDRQYTTQVCAELVGRDNFCVAFKRNSTFYRGCLNDFPMVNATRCMEDDDCEICEEDFCNNQQLVTDECYECDSRAGDCENVYAFRRNATICKDVTADRVGCYHYDNGDIIRRGCISSLTEVDYYTCISEDSCMFCQGNNCNSKESFLRCYSCSSESDLNCATVQHTLPQKICGSYTDTCKVFVKPNMTTHRGCSSELEPLMDCPPMSVNCRQCDDSLCNGGIFPSTRLSCHHCQSTTHPDCEDEISDTAISHPCENYNFRDSCYLHLDKNNVTTRGCLSDANIFADLCTSDIARCDVCSTSNCNGKAVRRRPSLSCVKCDSVSDAKCLWAFADGAATPCLRDLYFYEEESCFTFQISEQAIIRQCTLDSNVCANNPRCALCKTNACNGEQKANFFCHECSTDDNDRRCLNDLSSAKNVSCQGPVTYEQRGCFTWANVTAKSVVRGCLSDLSTAKRFQCINDHKNCEICVDEQNCNSRVFSGVGARAFSGKLLISALFAILLNELK